MCPKKERAPTKSYTTECVPFQLTWFTVSYAGDAAGITPTLHSVMVSSMVTRGEETAAPHRVRSDHSPALDEAISTAHTYLGRGAKTREDTGWCLVINR